MFKDASPYSDFVDRDFLIVLAICLVVLIGLIVAMIIFVIRYRRSRNPHPTNIEGHVPLEVLWTVVPLGLFMYMFYLGWLGYQRVNAIPEDSIHLTATARMWNWSFGYPDGVVSDTLYVPVNRNVKLTLRSLDVNHSMYIPAFRVKKDVIPNRENTMWFRTHEVGSYDIACAEYCGLRHAYMYTKVVSLDSAAFEQWYEQTSRKQAKPYTPFPAIQSPQ